MPQILKVSKIIKISGLEKLPKFYNPYKNFETLLRTEIWNFLKF